MVSRSLEKMILIAVGLSAAVIVGVPILLYSIDLLSNTTSLELAEDFANQIHSAVYMVDRSSTNSTEEEVTVPAGVSVSAAGHTLTVTYEIVGQTPVYWTEVYLHEIELIPPAVSGNQLVMIELSGGILEIRFIPHP